MAVTVATIEEALSKRIGDWVSGAASSAGNAGGTTVPTTSDDVMQKASQTWVPYQLHLTSGTYSGQSRLIGDFSVENGVGTFTVINAFGGQVASGVTFRVHYLPYSWKLAAIADAVREIHDVLPLEIVEEYTSGQLLRNGNLELWETTAKPYDWVEDLELVSGTIARSTTSPYQAKYCASLTGFGCALQQRIRLERDLAGLTITLSGYVKGCTGDAPVLQLRIGDTGTSSSTVITSDLWTKLSVSAAIANADQPIYARCLNQGDTSPAYFDALDLRISDRTYTYILPVSQGFHSVNQLWHRGPIELEFLASEIDWTMWPFNADWRLPGTQFDGYARLNSRITTNKPMRLVGTGIYPSVSAATDTVPILSEHIPLVVNRAGLLLMQRARGADHLSDKRTIADIEAGLLREEPLLRMRFMRTPPTLHLPLPRR